MDYSHHCFPDPEANKLQIWFEIRSICLGLELLSNSHFIRREEKITADASCILVAAKHCNCHIIHKK
ncbi:hypothetical protein DERF_011534 [Dermatophagoides farinae]|uniref:Uncharacterized protein n=1 Tax=Dermatophagoides farinae TaxID=6954 RepID=A0A922HT97_DERFA|nr:hypothetical protein DERF_011534 [Dermatophagoides farinae]